ncbi:MAG: hypothetical protein HUJ13_06925, partial [Hydrogenovibrio crunogenus]|nr:hypothetical protein [Hydrogenovibrio crunogenus]
VNRTVKIFSEKFDKVFLVYESRSSLNASSDFSSNVNVLYVDDTQPKFKVIPQLSPFIRVIQQNNLPVENIYIHDSGLLGVLLANRLRKVLGSKLKITLDYHDYVPWEVHYQLNKLVSNSFLNKIIGALLLSLFAFYFRFNKDCILDGVVGISEPQVKSILGWLGNCKELDYISIPNTRDKILVDDRVKNYSSGCADFLWIGNIVDGRDLPFTLDYLDELFKFHTFKFYVFGKIISQEVFNLLSDKSYFKYMGEFKNDSDMLTVCQNKKIIALFFGWDDKYQIGINEISSPNKVYSYINLGMPTLLYSKVNPTVFDHEDKIGKTFNDFESFKKSYELISENYIGYKDLLASSKENCVWESDLELNLSQFFDKVYFGVSNV